MVRCPKCTAENPDTNTHCSTCGAMLVDHDASTVGHEYGDSITSQSPAPPSRREGGGPEHGRFLPGSLVADRYRIVSLLGKGGMGEVYRADDLQPGESVALKFLPPRVAADPVALDFLRREVRTARGVTHPNVCRIHDIGETGGHAFICMEWVDGEDLATACASGTGSGMIAVALVAAVAGWGFHCSQRRSPGFEPC